MKPRSFTQRWNKTALKRIKKDFIKHESFFICRASREFSSLWADYSKEIRLLSWAFDPEEQRLHPDNGGAYLFYSKKFKAHKVAFLNHEIKRLSK